MSKETAVPPTTSNRLTAADIVEVSPLVDGRQVPSSSRELFTTNNPVSGQPLARFPMAVEAGCNLIQHANVTGPVPIP
jgi:hypothetical protein